MQIPKEISYILGLKYMLKIYIDTLSRELDITILNFREEKDNVFVW